MSALRLRQACDLCYRRKIKCDGFSPRCSQCNIHNSECTYVAPRRKKAKRKAAAAATQVETQPLESSRDLVGSSPSVSDEGIKSCQARQISQNEGHLVLPPSDVVYPLIETYLATVNRMFPLYDSTALLETASLWYRTPARRTNLTWATINVVMALAHSSGHATGEQPKAFAEECVRKAQSVLTELIMGNLDLKNLQVVLGLVMAFHQMPDMRPASVLISTAFRLIHEMQIHRREGYEEVSEAEALQRSRVFWVAYILDRDISMRTRQPPVHQDADTDLDLPVDGTNIDELALIGAIGGDMNFSAFRSRVHLAQLQGQVHDCLFSVQARYKSPDERSMDIARLRMQLSHWRMQIPSIVSPQALCSRDSIVLAKHFCMLYATNLSLLGQLVRLNAMDFEWINTLLRHVRNLRAGVPSIPPTMPDGWEAMVDESRTFATLFLGIPEKDVAFGRLYSCSLISALMFLSANSVAGFANENYANDELLRIQAKGYIDEFSEISRHEGIVEAQKAYAELDWQVGRLMEGHQAVPVGLMA